MLKLVYVAGPYRASTAWGVECNIVAARKLGAKVAQAGAYPVIPHSNTAHFDGLGTDELWLGGTLELMRRCDAVIFMPDWQRSRGAVEEHTEAKRRGLRCFFTVDELRHWLETDKVLGHWFGEEPRP